MIDKVQYQIGKDIDLERKKIILEIYKEFGVLNDAKLREIIVSKDSPVGCIISNPQILSMHMMFSIKLPEDISKKWLLENFIDYE